MSESNSPTVSEIWLAGRLDRRPGRRSGATDTPGISLWQVESRDRGLTDTGCGDHTGRATMTDFKAVLFDFDGILVDTEWAIYQAWKRMFESHGQPLPLEVYTRCIGTDFAVWSPKTHLEELTGKTFDWQAIDAVRQGEINAELTGEGPMAGAEGWIQALVGNGVKCAVVSSSSHHWVDAWLEKLGMTGLFEAIVCRGDAPRIKPAPDLFLEAARRLGAPSERCLVVEDSLNGIRAAKAAGMTVWAVPNRVTCGLDFSAADRVFPDLDACRQEWAGI